MPVIRYRDAGWSWSPRRSPTPLRRRPPPPRPRTRGIKGWGEIADDDLQVRHARPGHDGARVGLRFRPIWRTAKPHRQHVALGRIFPARRRLDVLDGRKIVLELRHQRRIRAALKHFG